MAVKDRGTKRSSDSKIDKKSKKSKVEVQTESEDELDMSSESEAESNAQEAEEEDGLSASEDESEEPSTSANGSGNSREAHQNQKQVLKERKTNRKAGIQVEQIKKLWEKLRVRNPPMPKELRNKLVNETWELCQGVLGDLVLKHDASRVVQTLVKYANKETRDAVCLELKPFYYRLATSAYGKYLLIKLLHYGSKESRALIIQELHGKLRKLMRHREGAYVVEDMFVLYSTSKQKQHMIKEFWGAQYAYFQNDTDETVVEVCKESPEKRRLIASNLQGTIQATVEKGSTGFQILHAAMREYIQIMEGQEIREFIDLLAEQVAELVHTPEGCEVACAMIAWANNKEKKVILKSLKQHAEALATNEHGQLVLQTIFMTVDDYQLVWKTFGSEFSDKMVKLLTNKFSRRPFIYLVSGLNKSYFNPLVMNEIDKIKEKSKDTSKRPEEERRQLHLKSFIPLFYKTVIDNTYELLGENMGAQFIQELIYNNEIPDLSKELRTEAIDKIIDCVRGDLTKEDHVIHKPFTPRLLKALIQGGKWNRESKKIDEVEGIDVGFDFASKFVEELFDGGEDKDTVAAWIEDKDSSFVLVGLVDCFKAHPKESISKKFQQAVKKHNKLIKKQPEENKGAKVLENLMKA